jgi:hypothetical protein
MKKNIGHKVHVSFFSTAVVSYMLLSDKYRMFLHHLRLYNMYNSFVIAHNCMKLSKIVLQTWETCLQHYNAFHLVTSKIM